MPNIQVTLRSVIGWVRYQKRTEMLSFANIRARNIHTCEFIWDIPHEI